MKKLLLAILITFGSFSLVSADLGVNLGISGSIGEYEAVGSEKEDTETSAKQKEKMLGGMASIFIEKELTFLPGPLKRLTIGYDKVMHDIATGTKDTGKLDQGDDGQERTVNQKVSADISNINTIYATIRITDWLYVKSGQMKMDVATTENLGTGSSYGDTNLDGTVVGIGLTHKSDNGLFLRAEYTDTSIDGVTLTSSNTANTVTLDGIDGTQGKISIGKSF